MTLSRIISAILFITICLMLLLSIAGCDDDGGIAGFHPDPVQLTSYSGPDHYVIPGTKTWVYVVCEPEVNRPEKPVYVWRISFNGNLLEEIVHDSEPKDEKKQDDDSYNYGSDDDLKKYRWPNSDDLIYEFKNLGTYTLQADLYDYNEFTKDKNKAMPWSSYTHRVHCDNVRLSIEAKPTENSREFTLKVMAENPQFMPLGCPVKWEFIDESTGLADAGPTEEISGEYSLFKNGILEVDHRFQKAGKYKATFTVVGYGPDKIASADTIVDVSQELRIIVPAGPLKTGQEYTFTARTDSPEDLPDDPVYEWEFGDSNGLIIPFSNEATYLYEKPGTYTLRVLLFESEDVVAPLLGVATTEITVEPGAADNLGYLQETTHLLVTVRGDTTYHQSDGYTRENTVPLGVYSIEASTKWTGTHFSNKYFSPPTDSSSGISLTIEGDVSQEGDKVFNLTATVVYDDAHRLAGEERETRLSLVNVKLEPTSNLPVPFNPDSKVRFTAYIEGPDVANFVNSTFYEHRQPQTSDPNFKMWYDPLRFTDTEYTPYLLIVFKTSRIDAYDDPGYQKRD
jgi:hypothetical protein